MENKVEITEVSHGMESLSMISLNHSKLPTLETLEKAYLAIVLKKTMGNKAEAAKILGVSIKTVYNKLDLEKPKEIALVKETV